MTPSKIRIGNETFMLVQSRDIIELQDRIDARRLLERLIQDRHDLRALRRLLEDLDPCAFAMTDRDVLTGAEALLASGRVVGVRVRAPARPLDRPEIRPLVDPDDPSTPNEPLGPRGREDVTWISVEVVGEDGTRAPGLPLSIVLPDGTRRDAVLDANARFAAHDVRAPEGTCEVTLHPHAGRPTGAGIALRSDDLWLAPERTQSLSLSCGRHHRLVVVAGRTEILVVDAGAGPIVGERCRVAVDGRVFSLVTDHQGMVTAYHPRSAKACSIEPLDLRRALLDPTAADARDDRR